VQLIKIEIVRLEPPQARLDRRHDVAARGARERLAVVHRVAEFAGEDDVLAALAEDAAERLFRAAAVAVGVGGVEQGDAEVERLVHHRLRRREIDAATEVVAAQPDQRHPQAGLAEIAYLHARPPHYCWSMIFSENRYPLFGIML